MRKFLIAIALLFGVVFILTRVGEVSDIYETILRGDWRFVILAFAVQAIVLFNVAASYQFIYQGMGIPERFESLLITSAAANFVNIVTPSGWMGGVAVFVSQAKRKGISSGRATIANGLQIFFEYSGFLFILALGLYILLRHNYLNTAELVASAIIVAYASLQGYILYLGLRSPASLGKFLAGLSRFINRLTRPFVRRDLLIEQHAHTFAHEASSGLRRLRRRPLSLIPPVLLSFTNKALSMLILALLFLAFNVHFSLGTVVAGFTVAFLFYVASPTPAGIGFLEGALTLALAALGVPLVKAAVIALAYRGITFWAPLLFGMISMRWLLPEDNGQEIVRS